MGDPGTSDVTALTVQLLTAYFANNAVPPENLAELVRATRSALLGEQGAIEAETPVAPEPKAAATEANLRSPDTVPPASEGNDRSTGQPARSLKIAPAPADVEAASEPSASAISGEKRRRRTARAKPVATKAEADRAQPARKPSEPKPKPVPANGQGEANARPKLKLFGSRPKTPSPKHESTSAADPAPVRSKYLRTT